MLDNVDQIVNYFMEYGYWFLFFGLLIEGEVILLTATLIAFLLNYSFLPFVAVVIVAAVLGDNIWYGLGTLISPKFLEKYGKYIFLPPARYEFLKLYIERSGEKALFFSKFMYGIGRVTILATSILGMPYKRFVLISTLSSLIWVFFEVSIALLLAYYFNLSLDNVVYSIVIIVKFIFILFAVQFLSRYIYFKYLKKKIS